MDGILLQTIRISTLFPAVGGADAEEEEEEAVVARMHCHTKPKPICMDWRGPSVGIVLLTMGVRTTRTNPAKTPCIFCHASDFEELIGDQE